MEVYLGDGVIFWEYLLFGVSTFDFLYLDTCFVLWTYVLCGKYLVLCFEVGMNLCACMDIFLIWYQYISICVHMYDVCGICTVFLAPFTIHPSTTCY